MKCPCCNVPTFVVEEQGIELDLCPDCRGVWFDRGELELLLGDGAQLEMSAAKTDEKLRRCPICRHKMDKVNIGPGRRVLIDVCSDSCGMWFDRTELAELSSDLSGAGWQVPAVVREFLASMFSNPDTTSN